MRQKHLKTETGMSAIETVAILAVVSFFALVAANFFKQPIGNFFGAFIVDKEIAEFVTKLKGEAELVVVGKIAGMSNQMQENTFKGDSLQFGHGLWTLEIESIERGHYSGDKIDFFVGWMSNRVMPQQFPPGIKSKYKIGDRIRVFLMYGIPGKGNNQLSYYTMESFFCMEPL